MSFSDSQANTYTCRSNYFEPNHHAAGARQIGLPGQQISTLFVALLVLLPESFVLGEVPGSGGYAFLH
jgi:hypothetical protein